MENEAAIFVNQVGYLPSGKKFAYVPAAACGDGTFSVCSCEGKGEVFSGKLLRQKLEGEGGIDKLVGEEILLADFSALAAEGKYAVVCGGRKSFPFEIKARVYDDLYFSVLNYFKLSRCGQGVCHTGEALVYGTEKTKNVQGGWHDAGDYGRYVVAAAKAVMDLLFARENSAGIFDRFDILAEVRFELEWMLEMQREDGAVFHKISCRRFCGFIMPQDEKDQLVLAPVSTAATADFAATLAYAAQFFKESDNSFAEKLLRAALKAQDYLDAHEDELYNNPPEITTGGYGDRDVSDERYFADCALFAATGEKRFLDAAAKIRGEKEKNQNDDSVPFYMKWFEGFSWGMVSGYGSAILSENREMVGRLEGGAKLLEGIEAAFMRQAERALGFCRNSAFGVDSPHVFWGSNGAVCDAAYSLLVAFRLSGRAEFLDAAKRQIDYILGCNPVNYCYVTGAGSKPPLHPHHRPSGASGKVTPGMLAGGPSAGLQDQYAKQHLQNLPPLKCYADDAASYSTNEVAIYWNSTFAQLLSNFLE